MAFAVLHEQLDRLRKTALAAGSSPSGNGPIPI